MNIYECKEMGMYEISNILTEYKSPPFMQTRFYGNWQKNLDREVRRFRILDDGGEVVYFQIIQYPLPFGKKYLYIPYGPVIGKDVELDTLLPYLKKEINKITKESDAVFTRLDFTPIQPTDALEKVFTKASPYTYYSACFQPRVEWYLQVNTKNEDELLLAMHEKTRYSIRLSIRKEVTTEIVTNEFGKYFEDFYRLMDTTATRNGFTIHIKEYYKGVFDSLSEIEQSYLVVSRYKSEILVIDVIVVFGGVAHFIFGGTNNKERNRMPTYAAHWEAIKYAKEIGCIYYNFGGISTEKSIHKGWDGVTVFKKKFSGEEIIHSDFFDVVVSPLWYILYNLGKWVRR